MSIKLCLILVVSMLFLYPEYGYSDKNISENIKSETKDYTVYNNGRRYIKVNDEMFYFDFNSNSAKIKSTKDFNAPSKTLTDTNTIFYSDALFSYDGFIYFTEYSKKDDEYYTMSISIETGKKNKIAVGEIKYLDEAEHKIYIERYHYSDDNDTPKLSQLAKTIRNAFRNSDNDTNNIYKLSQLTETIRKTFRKSDNYADGIYELDLTSGEQIHLYSGKCGFLGKDEDVIYFEDHDYDREKNTASFASVKTDGKGQKNIFNIPKINTYTDTPENIVDFGICGDWIILSIGSYEGSAQYFYGGLVKVKKDGSQISVLDNNDIDTFFINGDWLYYNKATNKVLTGYRINLKTETEEDFKNKFILFVSDSGKMYYITYNNKKTIPFSLETPNNRFIYVQDLYEYDPDTKNSIKMFDGSLIETYEHTDNVLVKSVQEVDDYVYFNATVTGYCNTDSWRGHTCRKYVYRTNIGGGKPELLYDSGITCPS